MASVMKPFRARQPEDSGFKSNNLWVGSLTMDTTESDLTELFGRFGDVDRITAYSSRGFAFIYYRHVEEAVAAKEGLRGAYLNGSQLKIEYARPAKPCKSLWVGGISPSVSKDDLEAVFSRFGKIEDFRFFRERKTALIDYYNIEDALQAMSMNGKRMGGSYLRVDYLRSQAPRKEQWAGSYDNRNCNVNHKPQHSYSHEDAKGDDQPSKVLWIGYPPSVRIDEQMLHNAMILFGEIERIKSYPSRHFSLVEFRSVEEARQAKEGLQGRLFKDPRITIMYSNDEILNEQDDTSFYSGMKRSRPDMFINGSDYNDVARKEPNWRRPSPAQGMRNPMRSNHSSWEGYDPAQMDRESKRTRRDGSVDGFTPMSVAERSFGRGSVAARPIRGYPDSDYMWRGMIAKGGTPVCCARCLPIGKGIETKLPEVINCSARTGLDMLAKHYTEAIGFEIVFFVPDNEEDFASYTEFLRYLGSKNRAGVAKLDNGTTLFLVPPSDFLTDILKVSGPERLYGVVLRLPSPAVPVPASYRQESHSNPLTAPSRPSVSEPLRIPSNAASQAGVSLTPELLATLASFLPATSQPAAAESQQLAPPPSYPPASNNTNSNYPSGMVHGNMQYQDQSVNMPQLSPFPNVHHNNHAMYTQGSSNHPVSQHMTQQYQPVASVPSYQQANYHDVTTNQAHNSNPSQFQAPMQPPADNANLEPQSQAPQLQPMISGAVQGTTDGEKDERYQKTLQFAASLLLQIKQNQQQPPSSTPAGQRP